MSLRACSVTGRHRAITFLSLIFGIGDNVSLNFLCFRGVEVALATLNRNKKCRYWHAGMLVLPPKTLDPSQASHGVD
jgi:hypothetical protein